MSRKGEGLTHVRDLLADVEPLMEVKPVSKRMQKRMDGIERIRLERQEEKQNLGYLGRPFILCGLPFKPKKGQTVYKRVNGDEVLEIHASPEYGLPFGADIQVLVWVSTLAVLGMQDNGKIPRVIEFASAADFLRAFGLRLDGASYKRAQERFLRIFYSSFFYGPKKGKRTQMFKFDFFRSIDLWFTHDLDTPQLPGEDFFNNRVVLSEEFAADLERHHPPIEMQAIAAWSDKPAQVYFYLWLVFRCYAARGKSEIPLMGAGSVYDQCGVEGYTGESGERNFVKKVNKWLDGVKAAWPECPASMGVGVNGRKCMIIERHAQAIHGRKSHLVIG